MLRDEHGNLRAVLRRVKDLFRDEIIRIDSSDFGRSVRRELFSGRSVEVVGVRSAGGEEGSEGEVERRIFATTSELIDRAEESFAYSTERFTGLEIE